MTEYFACHMTIYQYATMIKTYRQYNFHVLNLMSKMYLSILIVCGGHGTL